jgi:hypothetical protein
MNFGGNGPETIITRKDLRASLQAYEDLLSASVAYRNSLLSMSQASARFASAIERCSRLKGTSDECATRLQAAAGLYHVVANHEHVLADNIRQSFEGPLELHLQDYKVNTAKRSAVYEQALVEKSRIIRQTEAENMKAARRKQRDLSTFRATLAILQGQVDELDRVKRDYYESALEYEEKTWDLVLEKISQVVRSSLDVYDRITTKSSDPVLEPLLQAVPDPFDLYPTKAEDQIFSILPPLGILNSNSSSLSSSPKTSAPDMESKSVPALTGIQTWMNPAQPYPATPSSPEAHEWAESKPSLSGSSTVRTIRKQSLPSTSYLSSSTNAAARSRSLSTSPHSSALRGASGLKNVFAPTGESSSAPISPNGSGATLESAATVLQRQIRDPAKENGKSGWFTFGKPRSKPALHVTTDAAPSSSEQVNGSHSEDRTPTDASPPLRPSSPPPASDQSIATNGSATPTVETLDRPTEGEVEG